MSGLKLKKTWAVLLIALLLIFVSACSTPQTGEVAEEPGASTDDSETAQKDEPAEEPAEAQDDVPSYALDPEEPVSSFDPEEILEGYYYGIVDMPIIDFELEDLEGSKVRLSDLKGKAVFLNFWATWCPPCREEMPHMQEFYEKYKDSGVVILAVNSNQLENQGIDNSERAENKAREFIEQGGYTFPVLLDRDGEVWNIYMQRGIPVTYMIDKEGIIRYMKPGAFTGVEELEAFAKALGADI